MLINELGKTYNLFHLKLHRILPSNSKTLILISFQGNALIELKALIKEEEYYASSSDQLVNLSNLATLLSQLENEASLNYEAGFLGTFSSANEVIQNLQYDTDNNYYAENIQLILQENQAAYNQLANGQATLNDITPKIEEDLNLLVNALKADTN